MQEVTGVNDSDRFTVGPNFIGENEYVRIVRVYVLRSFLWF
jgi:hypothetical protein